MVKEGLEIEFGELKFKEISKDIDFISIIKDGKAEKYKIVDTQEELKKYIYKPLEVVENKTGIVVTCECNNISGVFYNVIFLEKFKIDSYCEPKIEESMYLSFNNCNFIEDIEMLGGDYKRIKFNDTIISRNLFMRFINCEKLRVNNLIIKENIILEDSEFGSFSANASRFEDNLLFQEVNILNDFILDKVIGNKDLDFVDCRFEGLSKLELDVNSELNFLKCSFYKKSEINFDELNGKISLYKTNFSDKCYLEYELLENKKYEPLIFKDDFKKTKWNFLIVSDIYKSSGRIEQYLETFYYFKKYERLEKKSKNKAKFNLLYYLIGITTKYYTSWERTLLSMFIMISVFFILYCSFPNLLMCKDTPLSSKNLFIAVIEMCQTSTLDIHYIISKFGNAFYFTIITFTTVGYGDITPLNWMKVAVGVESFLGIFFSSSFVVSLSRRFM
ncbi:MULTISPECIES: potassium channel family protein [unclassified Clostridium]|uniref:potassium channel family protein n=1 Tax=unclassified Clostridium TaxID=2614128 RepID=UPI000297F82F|nr:MULTISPECIES: potassium channel family protein [unclassified Clostridium]EKQ57902.1 MAG: Ion channel [Clostridium sp. Maddingley MBC34-26]